MKPRTQPHGGRNFSPREKKSTYTYEQLQEMQAWPLARKVEYARSKILDALKIIQTPSLAFSAGKDSTVLLHLLRQFKQDIIVIYGNTGIEFPECVRFAHWLKEEWNLNFYEAKPPKEHNFKWVVQNYGWPLMGKEFGIGGVAHKSSRELFFRDLEERGELTGQYAVQAEVPISSACCTILKERPSQKLQKELKVDLVFLGIMASESRRRLFNFLEYGDLYFAKSQKIWKCHPLSIWTDDDIWQYIRENQVPYSSLYDMGYYKNSGEWVGVKRNGCMYCGMDLRFPDNHLAIMRHTHPVQWRNLMFRQGLGKVLLKLRLVLDDGQLDMFEQQWSVEEYLERFPCAFDRI